MLLPKEKQIFDAIADDMVSLMGIDIEVYAFGSRVRKDGKGRKFDFDVFVVIGDKKVAFSGFQAAKRFETMNKGMEDDEKRKIGVELSVDICLTRKLNNKGNTLKIYPK